MPLRETEAKALIRKLLDEGVFVVSAHARDEMNKDNMTDVDAVNVLRGGVVRPAEYENGSWRYRVETPRMTVVVAFDPEPEEMQEGDQMELIVVTAWRAK